MDTRKINQIIGSNIKHYRMLAGLSQKKIGSYLNISFQQVQKYENGKDRISASFLYQISLYLKIPIASFFNGLETLEEELNEEIVSKYKRFPIDLELNAQHYILMNAIGKLNDEKMVERITKLIKTITQDIGKEAM